MNTSPDDLAKARELCRLLLDEYGSDTYDEARRRRGDLSAAIDALEAQGAREAEDLKRLARAIPEYIGDYECLQPLDAGGVGTVYLARDHERGRPVTLRLLADLSPSGVGLDRIRREGDALNALEDPTLVRLNAVGFTEDEIPFVATEYVDGVNLGLILGDLADSGRRPLTGRDLVPDDDGSAAAAGPAPYDEAVARLFLPIAEALERAHAIGVYHGNIEPRTILIDRRGAPRIVDFGISIGRLQSLVDSGDDDGTTASPSPPMQSAGDRRGFLLDLFSLGATLYHCLMLAPPFPGVTTAEAFSQESQRSPSTTRPERAVVSPALEAICHKAIHRDSARRYASASELSSDLRRFLQNQPLGEGADSVPHRWLAAGAVLLVAGLAALAIWYLFFR